MRRFLPALVVLLVFAIVLAFLWPRKQDSPQIKGPSNGPRTVARGPILSDLGTPPNWTDIESFQEVLTKEQFEIALMQVYALPDAWEATITIEEDAAWIRHHTGKESGESKIAFASEASEVRPLPHLQGLHIAIDPGHIGGSFAHLEQRDFQPPSEDPGQIPVREGDLTLATARHLKPLLEELGAIVTLVREKTEPVTTQRPDDFLPNFPDREKAEKVFYRTAEIRARAELVNGTIQPDLILCLHYNADAWSDPEKPWASRNHFHILLNGAYMPGELALDDQRCEMLRHLFTRTTHRAQPLAQTLSDVFLRETDLVPYHYPASAPALQLDITRPIYARNLLANRLYQAPTIFLEPYVMNHPETYERVQMGDYEGFKTIKGTPRRSLVREYAYTIRDGFIEHFADPML